MAKEKKIATSVENPGKQGKYSYEELERIAAGLQQQCGHLQQIVNNQQQIISEFNEIGMLLDVLGKSEHFDEKFVTRCSSKIEELITKAMDASEKQNEKAES